MNAALESLVQSRTVALTGQHKLLESIIDAMSEAVIAVDADGELRISKRCRRGDVRSRLQERLAVQRSTSSATRAHSPKF